MTSLSNTADEGDPYAQEIAGKKYSYELAADALFGRTYDDRPSLHVLLTRDRWKFSDDTIIGRDPTGSFHFHKFDDFKFPDGEECKYKVGTKTRRDGQVWVNVKFHAPDGSVFGEFVGHDKNKIVENARMQEAEGTGQWTKESTSTSNLTAYAKKPKDDSTLTVLVNGISMWKAEINIDQRMYLREGDEATDKYSDLNHLKAQEFAVHGRLVLKNGSELTSGGGDERWMRWDFDHFLFYKDDWNGRDYDAYFMFDEEVDSSMTAIGKVAKVIKGIKWTSVTEKKELAAAKKLFEENE